MKKFKQLFLTFMTLLIATPILLSTAQAAGAGAAAASSAAASASASSNSETSTNNSITKEQADDMVEGVDAQIKADSQLHERNPYGNVKEIMKDKKVNELEIIISVLEIDEIQGKLTEDEQIILEAARSVLDSKRNYTLVFAIVVLLFASVFFILMAP